MQFKTSFLFITLIVLIIIVLITFSADDGNKDENFDQDDETVTITDLKELGYPVIDSYFEINNADVEFLWYNQNISSELEKYYFFTDDSIETVIDWYSNAENTALEGWSINRTKVASTIKDPYNITYGYIKLKAESDSIFIVCNTLDESQGFDAETLCGYVIGDWQYIVGCGQNTS